MSDQLSEYRKLQQSRKQRQDQQEQEKAQQEIESRKPKITYATNDLPKAEQQSQEQNKPSWFTPSTSEPKKLKLSEHISKSTKEEKQQQQAQDDSEEESLIDKLPVSQKVQYKKELLAREQEFKDQEKHEKERILEAYRMEHKSNLKKSAKKKNKKYVPSNEDKEKFKKVLSEPHQKSGEIDVPTNRTPLSATSENCTVQIRLLNGDTIRVEFQNEDKLFIVCEYVLQMIENKKMNLSEDEIKEYQKGMTISTPYPRKKYEAEDLKNLTLKDIGIAKQGTVMIGSDLRGYRIPEKSSFTYAYETIALASDRLKGDTEDEKEEFKKKLMEKELEQKKIDKKKKIETLKSVRKLIKEDKKKRKEKAKKEVVVISDEEENDDDVMEIVKEKEFSNESCIVQVRLQDSSICRVDTLNKTNTLHDLYNELLKLEKVEEGDSIRFQIPFPRRAFELNVWSQTTLQQASLFPKGTIIVNPIRQ